MANDVKRTSKLRAGMRALLVAGVVAVPAVAGAPMAHAAVGDAASGGFVRHSTSDPTECFAVAFNVEDAGSGPSGTFVQVGYRCDGSGYTGNFVVANISCLVVSGSQATFSGVPTATGGFFTGVTSITEGVIDNSTPSSPSSPDRAVTARTKAAPSCALTIPANAYANIDAGDLRVTRGG
jgi:hypothetical protein